MILFPAIDVKDGVCVPARTGRHGARDGVSTAIRRRRRRRSVQGFEYLHVVDLDGAFAGKPMNVAAIERIIETTNISLQVGGGIRDLATIEAWLEKGVTRVIIGTAAVRDPELVKRAARKFPSRIAVGLDARDGMVAVKGWAQVVGAHRAGHRRRFGMPASPPSSTPKYFPRRPAQGPELDTLIELAERVSIGHCLGRAGSIEDGEALAASRARKLAGAIAGRAL